MDLRTFLISELGKEEGQNEVLRIYAALVKIVQDIPSLYESTLLVDDDDGDLTNGTPNICSIVSAYARHGLVEETTGGLNFQHNPLDYIADPSEPLQFSAVVQSSYPQCKGNFEGDVHLVYSLDEGDSWLDKAMEEGEGARFSAELDGFESGTKLLYRIEATETESNEVITLPTNPAEPYYQVYLGELEVIHCDDFESGQEGNWTHAPARRGEWRRCGRLAVVQSERTRGRPGSRL